MLINDDGQACLADFGLSRVVGASGFTTQTASTTLRFTPPELIPLEDHEEILKATAASDVWAFSMTVIEVRINFCRLDIPLTANHSQIETKRIPFCHVSSEAGVILAIASGFRPKREHCREINDDMWRMLEKCWREPKRRPTMATLFKYFSSQVPTSYHRPSFHCNFRVAAVCSFLAYILFMFMFLIKGT